MAKAPFEWNVSSPYGAPMGRKSDNPTNFTGKVHLRRVPFVDGDYDPGGAYWGSGGGALYCAWQECERYAKCTQCGGSGELFEERYTCTGCNGSGKGRLETETVYYLRAANRREAKRKLLAECPDGEISFYAYPGESDYH